MTFPRLKGLPVYQPTAAVVVLILYLTLLPDPFGEESVPSFPGMDKVAHFMMFGGLTGTFIYDRWRICSPLRPSGALAVALASTALGLLVEWLQDTMHLGRTGNDPLDALANTCGAFLAVPVCLALHWIDVAVHHRSGKDA